MARFGLSKPLDTASPPRPSWGTTRGLGAMLGAGRAGRKRRPPAPLGRVGQETNDEDREQERDRYLWHGHVILHADGSA